MNRKSYVLATALCVTGPVGFAASPSIAADTCRVVNMGSDADPDWKSLCKDRNGKTSIQDLTSSQGAGLNRRSAAPAVGHISVAYQGTYKMTTTRPGRASRGFGLNNILKTAVRGGNFLGAAANSAIDTATTPDQVTETGGGLTMTLDIDGDFVKGSYKATGNLRGGQLQGTRREGVCRLPDTDGAWVGPCDTTGFTGQFEPYDHAKLTSHISFETHAASVKDIAAEAERAKATAAAAASEREARAAKDAKTKAEEDAEVQALIDSAPRKKAR